MALSVNYGSFTGCLGLLLKGGGVELMLLGTVRLVLYTLNWGALLTRIIADRSLFYCSLFMAHSNMSGPSSFKQNTVCSTM